MISLSCGCDSTSSHKFISAIPRDDTEAYFVSEHAGLADVARHHNISIYWNGPSGTNDNEQQIALVERAISRGHFGIVLTPTAPFALDTVIERAIAHKIPVIILGAPISLPRDPNLSFVLNDSQRSGALAAERIHQLVGDKGEIALAGIDSMSPGSTSCAVAFETTCIRLPPISVSLADSLVRIRQVSLKPPSRRSLTDIHNLELSIHSIRALRMGLLLQFAILVARGKLPLSETTRLLIFYFSSARMSSTRW